jgi:hypothetical protein
MIQAALGFLKSLNDSRFFAGLVMLLVNVASRYVTVKLSKNQEQLIKNTIGRQFLIFAMAWMGTKDILLSLGLTAIFVVLTQFLFNEDSKFYILNKKFTSAIDVDDDDEISEQELKDALELLEKAKRKSQKQQKLLQLNNFNN